jgi:hypothetical protein
MFKDLIETAQILALQDRLIATEASIWHKSCREYSKRFHEPLSQVLNLDPLHVLTELYADQLSEWNLEEQIEDLKDLIGSIEDPNYDIEKERADRESLKKLEEEEAERILENRPIHESVEKEKYKFNKEDAKTMPKALPKSGGINFNAIRHLQSEEQGDGEF